VFFVPVGARGVFSLINETFSHHQIYGPRRGGRGEGEEGRKEEREGGGSAKCLGVCGMASLPYVQRRWKSSRARVPLRLDMQTKDDAGSAAPAAAAQSTVFSERGTGESSLRGAAALTVSRDERFELAAGPLAAQARGAA
jgi:hypothetical protein